jgi:hypothetical protein
MKLTLKRAVAAIFLMLTFASSGTAGSIDDAFAAHDKGDYPPARLP